MQAQQKAYASIESELRARQANLDQQLSTRLVALESQQKDRLASLEASQKATFASLDKEIGQAIGRIEERIDKETKEYLQSQGNIGTKMNEIVADARIIQGKIEENNQAVAEVGTRLDGALQQVGTIGERSEKLEKNANSVKEAALKVSDALTGLSKRTDEINSSVSALKSADSVTAQEISQIVAALKAIEGEINSLKQQHAEAARSIEAAKAAAEAASAAEAAKVVEAARAAEATKGREEIEDKKGAIASSEPTGPNPASTGVKPPSAEKISSARPSEESKTPALPPGLSPDKLYQMAYGDYNKGSFDLAIEGFSSYLSSFPNGTLAPNAQYWLGECYFSQRKFDQAIEEFDKVVKTYPKGARVPSALLKKAYSYLELKDRSQAQQNLELVVKRYPQSREATLAKDKLRAIR
jgi:tol-pal system protein YbgF